jgi:hypothetical protein
MVERRVEIRKERDQSAEGYSGDTTTEEKVTQTERRNPVTGTRTEKTVRERKDSS